MSLQFNIGNHKIKVHITENEGRFAAKVQCPLCSKEYKSGSALTMTGAKYSVRDQISPHIRRKHNK